MEFKVGIKDDPLIFLHYCAGSNFLGHSKLLIIFSYYMAGSTESFVLLGILHLIYREKVDDLWKFMPFQMFMHAYGTLFLANFFFYNNYVDHSPYLHRNGLSLKSAGEKMFKQMSRESKYIVSFCLISTIMVTCTTVLFTPFLGDEAQFEYPAYLVRNYSIWFRYPFYVFIVVMMVFTGISTMTYVNFPMYALAHGIFQCRLLNAYIIKFGCRKGYHINDVRYQERIARQLKICVKMQVRIYKVIKRGDKFSLHLIALLCSFGLTCFVSSFYFIKMEISPASNFRMYAILADWLIILLMLCSYGQRLTDEVEKTFWNLCKCHWEDWNNQNRRTFSIMLLNASSSFNFNNCGFKLVNHELLVGMWRVGNALVSIFTYQFQ